MYALSTYAARNINMASSIGVKNYLVQARKAAMNGNYDFL